MHSVAIEKKSICLLENILTLYLIINRTDTRLTKTLFQIEKKYFFNK